MYVDSGIAPLFIRREELGLRYMSRVLTSKLNPNFKYVSQPIDRAPTRSRLPKPLEVRLESAASRVGLLPSAVAEVSPSKFPPWNRPSLEICSVRDSRKISSDEQLRASFLDHASDHAGSYHIYTDGSKGSVGVGCSVVTANSI